MHRSKHTGNEPVYTPTFLDKRHQGRYPTLVVRGVTEVGENHLLERVDLVLKAHEVRYSFIPVGRESEQKNRGNERDRLSLTLRSGHQSL